MRAGLVYLVAAEAALGVAAERDTSLRVCLCVGAEGWSAGDTDRGASDRRMPGVSSRFQTANAPLDVMQGPASRWWGASGGKVLFPLSSWTWEPRLPQPGSQDRGSRSPPTEGPLGGVGCPVLGPTRSGRPAWACSSRNQVPETARMGTRVGWPGRFTAVMLGGRVDTFCQLEAQFLSQPGWPLAEHLGTWASPCPLQGQNWENQQGTSELPEEGLPWAASSYWPSGSSTPLWSSAHPGCEGRGLCTGQPLSGKGPRSLRVPTQRPSLARPSEG